MAVQTERGVSPRRLWHWLLRHMSMALSFSIAYALPNPLKKISAFLKSEILGTICYTQTPDMTLNLNHFF